ncbi:MAG: polyprenyl synthetase family protein [Parcubacteria group bacterium]|nr:polyprenyl synthetase family protein [Parcubacteria group bacterium]
MNKDKLKFKSFQKLFNQYQRKINLELEKFFNKKIKESSVLFTQAIETIKILRDINLGGGKRIRPILINIGYFLAGGKDKKAILKTCLCIELIHNWFLIHDDIIDQDELRRGRPSLYKLYQEKMKDDHAGISLAIVAGDISAALGYWLLANGRFQEKFKTRALNIFYQTVVNTCHGEMLELFIKEDKDKLKEKDILNLCEYKTAYYTFVNPLKIGAVLAGANDRFLKQIEKFALPIGIAFQIRDDILGLFASQKKLGKPIVSDIKENQPNLLIFKTLALANLKDRQEFKKYLGKKNLSWKDIQQIRKIVKQSGSLDYCQKLDRSLIDKAKLKLQKIKMPQKEKEFLLTMADYIIDRPY